MEKGEMAATEIKAAVAKKDLYAGIATSSSLPAIQVPLIVWNQNVTMQEHWYMRCVNRRKNVPGQTHEMQDLPHFSGD